MADKLVAVRIKQQDNTYSNEIPIGARAENVAYDNTKNLLQVLGTIDMYKGDVQTQLNALFEDFSGIAEDVAGAIDDWVTEHMPSWDPEEHLDDTLTADNLAPVSSAVPKLIAVNEAEIQGTKMKINTAGQEDLTVLTPSDIDNTLSQQGEAADAKATGEMIMINNAATAGTKIRLVTTEEEIDLATKEDADNLAASLADEYDPTATYTIGEYCTHQYRLYRCTTAIPTAEAWTAGHWTVVPLSADLTDQVGALKESLSNFNSYDVLRNAGHISRTAQGITFTWNANNTVCNVSGTATGTSAYTMLYNDNANFPAWLVKGNNYIFHINKTDSHIDFRIVVYYNDSTPSREIIVQDGDTITFPVNSSGLIIMIRVPNGYTVNGTISVSMLNSKSNKELEENIGDLNAEIELYTKDLGILHDNIEYSKNLAIMVDSSKTVSSVDMSWTKDNVVTWNGTSTASGGRITHISNKISLLAGTYTLSVTPLNSAASSLATRLTINVVDTSNTIIFSATANTSGTHTFDADTEVYLSFTLTNGTTYNNAQAGVMLNAGDTRLPFESYYHNTISDEQARDDIETLETKISNKPFLPFKDKKIVVFGDSRTWYDGQTYGENTKSEWAGKTCVGYQDELKKILDTDDITNEGISGNTSPQICDRVRLYDFTGFDAVLLEGGVNDWVKSSKPEPGTLLPVGSTFDTTTIYGAWQSAVEYILTNYPSIQIFMDVPAIAWTSNGVYPYKTASIKAEVAKLYNIPYKDMYKELGINEVNRDYYYCDDVNATGWRLHFNDYGNALFGTVMAQFMNTVCGDITYADTEEKTAEIYPVVKATSEYSKNIIKLNNTSTTVGTNVVVASNEQNEITYNGTSAGTTGRTKKLSALHALPAGTYTLSAKYNNPESYNWRTRLTIYVCDSANNTIAQFVGTPQTFTINAETNVYISTTVSSGTNCGGFSLSVMLNTGNSALPFEAPGEWSAVDVKMRSELHNIVSLESMRRIMERNYVIQYANAVNRLNLINVYGTNQNVHPKVLYFESLFGGHRYWMAYTPYTNESTEEENPCIAYSDDGIDWTNIEENPLATGTTDDYYSDTHLVYNSTTGLLECWYRLASNTNNAEYIYRKTSTDGVSWGTQELMQTFTNGRSHALSPSIIWDATNQKYQIWIVNSTDGHHVEYYESSNGTTWTKIRDINLTYADNGTNYYVWHIDVSLINGVYYLIAMCKNENASIPWPLFVASSSDNIVYTTPVILMLPQSGAWDAYLYRSCLVKTADDYRLYYSARTNNGRQGMSISIASSLYKFIGYDLIS